MHSNTSIAAALLPIKLSPFYTSPFQSSSSNPKSSSTIPLAVAAAAASAAAAAAAAISFLPQLGGGPSPRHSHILQAVIPLLSHANIPLATHVVIARMVRSVADNAGEDVCDALSATAAIPSVSANLQKAPPCHSPDVCAMCSHYFFFLASLCHCTHAFPLRAIASQWPAPPREPFISRHFSSANCGCCGCFTTPAPLRFSTSGGAVCYRRLWRFSRGGRAGMQACSMARLHGGGRDAQHLQQHQQ